MRFTCFLLLVLFVGANAALCQPDMKILKPKAKAVFRGEAGKWLKFKVTVTNKGNRVARKVLVDVKPDGAPKSWPQKFGNIAELPVNAWKTVVVGVKVPARYHNVPMKLEIFADRYKKCGDKNYRDNRVLVEYRPKGYEGRSAFDKTAGANIGNCKSRPRRPGSGSSSSASTSGSQCKKYEAMMGKLKYSLVFPKLSWTYAVGSKAKPLVKELPAKGLRKKAWTLDLASPHVFRLRQKHWKSFYWVANTQTKLVFCMVRKPNGKAIKSKLPFKLDVRKVGPKKRIVKFVYPKIAVDIDPYKHTTTVEMTPASNQGGSEWTFSNKKKMHTLKQKRWQGFNWLVDTQKRTVNCVVVGAPMKSSSLPFTIK